MNIIGISPLDKDSTVCLVQDGKIVAAIAEERLSRNKMHAGFPDLAMQELFTKYNLDENQIDCVAYAFDDWDVECKMVESAQSNFHSRCAEISHDELFANMKNLPVNPDTVYGIPGLVESELYMNKGRLHDSVYKCLSTVGGLSKKFNDREFKKWIREHRKSHEWCSKELNKGLKKYGLDNKLTRVDHHRTHAANAFYTSGFEDALIVTLDGYGGGCGGSVSVGSAAGIELLHSLPYPSSLGEFYERVTASLGFKPGRHEGKIVGLAAYESPDILYSAVRSFFHVEEGEVFYRLPHNFAFSRYLASRFSKPAVASAFQKVLEDVSCEYVAYYLKSTGLRNVVLSGGVVANVKANQRIFEIDGVDNIYIHPNMGDGGCGVGAALEISMENQRKEPYQLNDVYLGQEYTDTEIKLALDKENLTAEKQDDIEVVIAKLLAEGNIVARFNGRMEYGPRSLGNRSILYHASDPSVNLWLNQRLNRTEFMPFAPATLFEERERCYLNMKGAEYTSRFMTITFDCTEFMKEKCPAAVHIDGTARPQLVSSESNQSFHRVLSEYYKLTGIPSVINTSFNMHEEPIVCTPYDAIRAFLLGELPYLAIGSYLVKR